MPVKVENDDTFQVHEKKTAENGYSPYEFRLFNRYIRYILIMIIVAIESMYNPHITG